MRKRIISMALLFMCLSFSGCGGSGIEPMKSLPPAELTEHSYPVYTASTDTDGMYIASQTVPAAPSDDLEMPDFPDIDNPINDIDFDRMFDDMPSELTAGLPLQTEASDSSAEMPPEITEAAVSEEYSTATVTAYAEIPEYNMDEAVIADSEPFDVNDFTADTYNFSENTISESIISDTSAPYSFDKDRTETIDTYGSFNFDTPFPDDFPDFPDIDFDDYYIT